MTKKGTIRLFVITHNTKDFGDKFVVRGRSISRGIDEPDAEPTAVCDNLEEARDVCKAHPSVSTNIGRSVSDDPVIIESWA